MGSDKPRIVKLPVVADPRGNLSFIQAPEQVDFDFPRCYWVYDVPSGRERDGHAYYTSRELIVALSGSLDVTVDDGSSVTTYRLTHPSEGLEVPPMHWRELNNFSTNAVAMVLASTLYTPEDYIERYNDFQEAAHERD